MHELNSQRVFDTLKRKPVAALYNGLDPTFGRLEGRWYRQRCEPNIYSLTPTTEPIVPGFIPAPRLDSLENKRLGLIDDAKDGAQVLLEEITDVLKERYGVASVNYHRKPSASKPVDPGALSEMTKDCDYVVIAIGS